MKAGILALQGDYDAHRKAAEAAGAETCLVRTVEDLAECDGLILPGGESTTIGKLLDRSGLMGAIRGRAQAGMPVLATCAGLILLAREIEGSDQPRLGLMDIAVARNAFGRQVESFEANIPYPSLGEPPVRGVFIRAPYVTRTGPSAEVLAEYEGKVVGVRQGNLVGLAFHPELTSDGRVHRSFVNLRA